MQKEVALRSPFNGERVVMPSYVPADTLKAMLEAGFTRIEDAGSELQNDGAFQARKKKEL